MSIMTDIKNGHRNDIPKDILEILEKFNEGDAKVLEYMIGNKQVRDAIGDRVSCLSRLREVAHKICNDSDDKVLNDLIFRLSQVDLDTWYDLYHAGFNDCYWSDSLIQGIIQEKIKANKWLFVNFNDNGILNLFSIRNKKRSENITGHGTSMTTAMLDAYIKAVNKWIHN